MSQNLAATTKLKVSQLYQQSFIRLIDRRNMFFIGHKNGIHIYDIGTGKIEEFKLDKSQYSGPFSCFTVSDQLIFFCCGSKVLAMGNNLKILFQQDTYLAVDKINSIHVYGYRLFLISENMLNEFLIGGVQLMNKKSRLTQSPSQKSQDVQQQVFDAKINHSLLITITAQKPFLLLLKSNNQIEVFEKKQPQASFQTNSPPTYAYRYPQNQENENRVLVGTASGQILYLEVNRKSIKQLWSINETKGRINTICELKGGFFIARDKSIQFWSKNKEILKEKATQQKTICSSYLPTQELLIYGTTSGSVTQMKNYEKYIKESKKLNEAKERQELIKQIQLLRYKKSLIQQKILAKKNAQKQVIVSSLKKINVKSAVSIDYVNLCYNIQLDSQQKICKIIVQGPIVLLEEKENIFFEGSIENDQQKVYILRYDNEKNIQIKAKYQEVFNPLDKLNLMIYFSFEARVHSIEIDLKQLSLHQKVSVKSFDQKNPYLNRLQIKGNFKFEMKMWMNSIFNDFSTEEIDDWSTSCYESVITKNKILVRFKAGCCILIAESVIPLLIIKKKLMEKSRQKSLSLGYETSTSPESIKQFITKIQPQMKEFIEIKKKYELLPGLLQLKNELSIQQNEEMLKILDQRETITSKYQQNIRLQTEIKQKIIDLYRSYKQLTNKNIAEFQEKAISNAIQKWDTPTIISTICG